MDAATTPRAKLATMDHVLAVDIGGTKLAAGVVDADGSLVARAQTPTVAGDGEGLFVRLSELIAEVRADVEAEVLACGVGCGGPMEPGGTTVSPLNIAQWRHFPLLDRLTDLLNLPTWIDNDAKALAVGEGWVGAASESGNFLSMVVSTGVGGGLVLDGRLLDGRSGNAGHIGHVIAVPDGRPCSCGARGCLEAEASGTAIAAITGAPPAQASDEVRARAGTLVGRVVGSVANLLDLSLAVVSGSVALGYGETFFAAAQAEIDNTARLDFSSGAKITPGGLGDAGPLVGAGALAWRGLGRDVGVR